MEEPQPLTSPELSAGPKDAAEKHEPRLEVAKSRFRSRSISSRGRLSR